MKEERMLPLLPPNWSPPRDGGGEAKSVIHVQADSWIQAVSPVSCSFVLKSVCGVEVNQLGNLLRQTKIKSPRPHGFVSESHKMFKFQFYKLVITWDLFKA